MKNYFLAFTLLLIGSLKGYTQTGFSVHAGPSIIFRDYKFETSSLKESGVNLELQYQSEISEKLDFHIELDYL